MCIRTVSRDHLELLCFRHAARRIENDDLRSWKILKAFECCLSRISGSSSKDADLLVKACLLYGSSHEMREHLERYVLECTRGTVPELKDIFPVIVLVELYERDRVFSPLLLGICLTCEVKKLSFGEVRQEHRKDFCGDLIELHVRHGENVAVSKMRYLIRHEKSPVGSNSLYYRLGSLVLPVITSCTYIIH